MSSISFIGRLFGPGRRGITTQGERLGIFTENLHFPNCRRRKWGQKPIPMSTRAGGIDNAGETLVELRTDMGGDKPTRCYGRAGGVTVSSRYRRLARIRSCGRGGKAIGSYASVNKTAPLSTCLAFEVKTTSVSCRILSRPSKWQF